MSSQTNDIFRQLTAGASFNFKKFRGDVEKLKLLPSATSHDIEVAAKRKRDSANEPIVDVAHFRAVNRISVHGLDIPDPVRAFDDPSLSLHPDLLRNISGFEFSSPTPIQMQALPVLTSKRNILASAETGSGKTWAFLIPAINAVAAKPRKFDAKPKRVTPRVLILAPTRELVSQLYRETMLLVQGVEKIRVEHLASPKTKPIFKDYHKVDILVSNLYSVSDLVKRKQIDLSHLLFFICDEADRLFEEDSSSKKSGKHLRQHLATIYKACDPNEDSMTRAFFSATFSHGIRTWAESHVTRLIRLSVGGVNCAVKRIDQSLVFTGDEAGKVLELRNMFLRGYPTPVLVFVQSNARAKQLFDEIRYDIASCDAIFDEKTDAQRADIMNRFRSGTLSILICTDVIARGIDFKGVNLVINYDLPLSAVTYIHRIGRTGRAGRAGKAITYYTSADVPNLRAIANVIKQAGCPVPKHLLVVKKLSRQQARKLERTKIKRNHIRPNQEDLDKYYDDDKEVAGEDD